MATRDVEAHQARRLPRCVRDVRRFRLSGTPLDRSLGRHARRHPLRCRVTLLAQRLEAQEVYAVARPTGNVLDG